ncbi:MAG: hypothetical protein IJA90_08030 [Peptococcaceae bacterium]|nr:hypothetical protein [Peptococcaceae bacterium]
MKKYLIAIILCLLVFCGCQPKEAGEPVTLRIVDGAETGNLVLAGETASDVYTLSVEGITVYLDGEKADASVLEDGMKIDIVHSGEILETYPASFGDIKWIDAYSLGTEKNPGGSYYDLCGLYLKVLDDLWEKDSGLNGEINYVSVDLSKAPGNLTDGEKAAIAWIFGGNHNVTALTLPSDELAEQGYFTEISLSYMGKGDGADEKERKIYQWDDGVLFTIVDNRSAEEIYSLPVIKFDAMKWRTPLGAYYFSDCSAVWPQMGTWSSYNVEHEMIS